MFFQYSPELGETRIRLHVTSKLKGPKDLIVTEPFKVYLAAGTRFQMPNEDGNRSFSFRPYASQEFFQAGTESGKAVVYNENDLSVQHRAYFLTPGPLSPATINDRIVTSTEARGTFPFMKRYDEDLNNVTEEAFSPVELNPLVSRDSWLALCRHL